LRTLSDRFEIVAVCAGHRTNAESLARSLQGTEVCDTAEELLARSDIEAVDIATPIALNARLAELAAGHGKHVFLEKPIAARIDDAPMVASLPERHGTILLVAETNRYSPGYMAAIGLVEDDRIGTPRLLHWDNMSQITAENPYSQTAWRQAPEHIGGYLSDGGVHAAAALQMVAGPVASLHALTASFNPELLGPVDTMIVNLRFDSGLPGTLKFSVGVPDTRAAPLTIHGTEGRLEIEPGRVTVVRDGRREVIDMAGSDPFVDEFRDFYDAVVEGKPLRTSPDDAVRDLAIVDAALRSAESGAVVNLI
jgi:predicted dehydrogenase